MAKVSAPLLSFGASGSIANVQTYFPWKGLNCVRKYVIPSNPRTTAQVIQRGYITTVVALIHTAMSTAANKLSDIDKAAYSLLASVQGITMTWFNAASKQGVDQNVAAKKAVVYRDGTTTPGWGSLAASLYWSKQGANDITAGTISYGPNKAAMLSSMAATILAGLITATIPGLTAGVKTYWQFRPTAHADFVGANSGIYYGTPT